MTSSSGTAPLAEAMTALFGTDGLLAEQLPGYEPRPSQLRMAEAVATALAEADEAGAGQGARLLAVEAGTGTGKTLAYLVPAILSGRKVVVSTNTLTLQDQILDKEIPFIRRHIAPQLNVVCVKGRQNYLCLHRWNQLLLSPQRALFADELELGRVAEWLAGTESGDRAELTWLADNSPLWPMASATTSQCLGGHCPEQGQCFVTRLRKQAAQAQVLIVNHHLYFSDLAIRREGHAEVLPRYEAVIFDEAHHLESVATRYFGISFSHYQVTELVRDLETAAQADLAGREREGVVQTARALARQADLFAGIFPRERGRFPLPEFINACPAWHEERQRLTDHLLALRDHLEEVAVHAESWLSMLRRTEEMLSIFATITEPSDRNSIYWYERREKTVALASSPIDIAGEMRDCLYSQAAAVVFTSATLATAGSFAYFFERLGITAAETLLLPTPFDYPHRTRLFIPAKNFPEPTSRDFAPACQRLMREMILLARGRALLLFTSINAMRAAHEALRDELPFPLLLQGEAPKAKLLEQFRKETHSVLLAVASFWEGVDVPGESLSCVIIDKLPFEVPTDPVIMARMERIRNSGGNPFFDFQVPRAILSLRQGVGRLMRSSTDRGVLAICDVRLFTKQYGRLFLQSLPPSPVCRDLDTVADFFGEE
ncbi:MAG: ATP-dependent DNA helicase [Thermodesulfobacteriota bacterium]